MIPGIGIARLAQIRFMSTFGQYTCGPRAVRRDPIQTVRRPGEWGIGTACAVCSRRLAATTAEVLAQVVT